MSNKPKRARKRAKPQIPPCRRPAKRKTPTHPAQPKPVTGLQMYNALRSAIRGMNPGAKFKLNTMDATTLLKLSYDDLRALNYGETAAEQIVADLNKGRLQRLSETLGIHFEYSHDEPTLL